ncbi:MAG: ImmA/IrrE family metallo-endopeptidase [Clostridiales bacterium]|nr:ImmA/IrrE family metallo-endopeptidase [Clostridiales bacterium]
MNYLINEAITCLMDSGVRSLPIKADKLSSKRLKWHYATYSEGYEFIKSVNYERFCEDHPAFSMRLENGYYIIFYNGFLPFSHINYILAHEIGHILLGHCLPDSQSYDANALNEYPDNAANSAFMDEFEREADMFASHILAPLCILSATRVFTPEGIETETAIPARLLKNIAEPPAEQREMSYSEMRLCMRFLRFILLKRALRAIFRTVDTFKQT